MNSKISIPQLHIQGKGQPFIWLHGMLYSVDSDSVYSLIDFNELANQVSVVRYNVCDKSVNANYSWDDSTEELFRIANSKNYSSVIVGGSSMGSGTAIHFAVRFPERVKALILVTPPPAWEMRKSVKTIYTKIASKADPNFIPEFLKRIIQMNQDPPEFYEQFHPGTRQLLTNYRLSFDPAYYSKIYLGGAASDLPSREQIAQIDVPTLIVSVPDDKYHPMIMAQELNSLIKNSELVEVTNYEDFIQLQKKIRDFITELDSNNKS